MSHIRAPRTVGIVACALLLYACGTDDEIAPDDDVQNEDPEASEDAENDNAEDAGIEDPDADETDADEDPAAQAEDPDADTDDEATEVSIVDNAFEPEAATIAVGETVTWTHDGDITHNVVADDEAFASDNLSPGDSFEHTFDEAGTFEYLCTIHGQVMSGTVEVED